MVNGNLARFAAALLTVYGAALPFSIAAMQIVLGVLAAVWLVDMIRVRRRWLRTPLDRQLGLFAGALLLSTLFSDDPAAALPRYIKLWILSSFFVTFSYARRGPQIQRVVGVMVAVAAIVGVYSAAQYFTGVDLARTALGRPPALEAVDPAKTRYFATGFFPQHLTYGHSLLIPLGFATGALLTPAVPWRVRGPTAIAWVLCLGGLTVSLARGAWLGFVAQLLTAALVRGRRTAVLSLAGISALVAITVTASPVVRERARSAVDLQQHRGRLAILAANWEMVRDHPLLGVGFGRYRALRDTYYARHPDADRRCHAHNNFLQIWAVAGLPGLGTFCYLWWVVLRTAWRGQREMGEADPLRRALHLGAFLGILGVLAGGLTEYNFGDAEVATGLWFSTAILLRLQEKRSPRRPLPARHPNGPA